MGAVAASLRAVGLVTLVLVAGCAGTPPYQGLAEGPWQLTTADGEVVGVRVSALQANEYYFDAQNHPISGVYALEGDRVILRSADNPRLAGYVWRERDDRSLILIAEAPVELSGDRLISSTLRYLP